MEATNFEEAVEDEIVNPLPEAPASVNVKFWIDDYGCMLTMRGTKAKEVVKQLEWVVNYAKEKGWASTWNKDETPPKGYQGGSKPAPPADPNAPSCPTHNRPMRKFDGKYGPFWKCTAKIGDGWCNESISIKGENG